MDVSFSTSYENMFSKLSELPLEDKPEQLGLTMESWLAHKQMESTQLQQFIYQLNDKNSNQKL